MKHAIAISLLCSLVSAPALAGEFTLGLGAIKGKAPYKGFDNDVKAYPVVEYSGEHFTAGGDGISYHLYPTGSASINPYVFLGGGGDGYKASDSKVFKGMAERDASTDLGVGLDFHTDLGTFSASVQHDISGAYEGLMAEASYSYVFEANDITFVPSVGISYLSEDYVNYYYGVRKKEATASRAQYKGDNAITPWAGYLVNVPLGEHWSVHHFSSMTWLSDEIKDSPLVDRDNTWMTGVGVSYTF